MAYDSSRTSFDTKIELPAEEFQRKLHRWFEEQGLLSDLRAHMRQLMVAALRRTQLGPQAGHSTHQNTSPKIQAVNLLVAEFLLLQECHYTLSVFTSEVPLLRNLPEFSASFKDAVQSKLSVKNSDEVSVSSTKLLERHVWDILEALGFSSGSSAGETVFRSYKEGNGESLLICLIRSISKVIKFEANGEKGVTEAKATVSNSESDSSVAHIQMPDAENEENLQKKLNFEIPVIHKMLQELPVKPRHIRKLESEIKRLVHNTQVAEQHNFHEKLLYHENRIREERARYEKELQEQIVQAQQRLAGHCATVEAGLKSREAQVMAAADRLQHRLRLAEEENNRLRKLEQERQERRSQQIKDLKEKKSYISEDSSADKRKSVMMEKETSSEQLKVKQNDIEKTFRGKSSQNNEEDTNEEGEKWYIARTPSNLELETSVSSREQGVQVGKPAWQLMNDLEEVRRTLQQLQQENEELRSLMRRQQEQVTELRAWGQVHMAASVSHSPAQMELVAAPDPSLPNLAPPLPPRLPRQHQLFHSPDEELNFHAGGAPCVVPASTQTPVTARSRTRRLRRFPVPRPISLSSDDTSPTEEMLEDARRRLRELEEESEAVDRSYREFCLRHTRKTSVANVLAGILHPSETNEQPHSNEDNSSSDTAIGSSNVKIPKTSPVAAAVTALAAPVDKHHSTWPTVTRSSDIYLSDIVYSIPSSELISRTSSTQNEASMRKNNDSRCITNMLLQNEVYTTDIYNAPLLSSTVGNIFTDTIKAATGDGKKPEIDHTQTEEMPPFNSTVREKSIFPDDTFQNRKTAPGCSKLNNENGRSDAEQIPPIISRNVEVLYQKLTDVDNAHYIGLERSSQLTLKINEVPNPRLSDLIFIEKSSDKIDDEARKSCQERDTKKNQSSRTDAVSTKSSLGETEFIPANSRDQLFVPSHDVADESDYKSSISDMVPVNSNPDKFDEKLVCGTGNQTLSNNSTSSDQQISAGSFGKSVDSNAYNFW